MLGGTCACILVGEDKFFPSDGQDLVRLCVLGCLGPEPAAGCGCTEAGPRPGAGLLGGSPDSDSKRQLTGPTYICSDATG